AGAIEVSGAADTPRWLTKKVLWEMFAYPFEHLGCQIVVMRVSTENTRLHRILTAYGFECYRIPRLRGRHEDELIFTLTDDDPPPLNGSTLKYGLTMKEDHDEQ